MQIYLRLIQLANNKTRNLYLKLAYKQTVFLSIKFIHSKVHNLF